MTEREASGNGESIVRETVNASEDVMEGEAIDAEADRNRGNEWVEGDGEFRVCEKVNGLDDVMEDDEVNENVDRKGIEGGKTNDKANGRERNDLE
jgi:hypothetical protein